MRVLLVGGGKVGSFLARELLSVGHAVTVIESSEARAQALADDVNVVVIGGDGTNVNVLESGGVHRADWLLAVTGLDEVNLVACQIGLSLGTRRVLARLNNPLNRATFDALEIPVVGVTDLMVQVISQELAVSDLERVAVFGKGSLSLSEFDIPDDYTPTPLKNLELPVPSVIAVVLRGDDAIVPDANTTLAPGDRVVAITPVALESALREVFNVNGDET